MYFSDTGASFPKNCRQIFIDDDITTNDQAVRESVERNEHMNAARNAKERAAEKQRSREEVSRLLAKTKCEGGIAGECGPGRACVYDVMTFMGKSSPVKGSGRCMAEDAADREIAATNQERKLDRIIQNQQNQERELGDLKNTMRNNDTKEKIDRIDRKLRWGF